jgi:Ran GTPase-activating protein (RanGAP) involved in mRNA processing and transport
MIRLNIGWKNRQDYHTNLNIKNNGLGESAGKVLTESLCNNTTLIELNIGWNGIGESAGEKLTEALYKNITLTQFRLSG